MSPPATSHCCRSCASLASTSAGTTSWVAQGRRKRPQALSGRAFGPAERRRDQASKRGGDVAGVVAAAAAAAALSSSNRKKNLAVVFGLGAASPLPAARRKTTTAAAAAPPNADLPPAPVRSHKEQRLNAADARRELGNQRRQVAALELAVAALESRQSDLATELEKPETYTTSGRAVTVNAEVKAVAQELAQKTAEWEAAATRLAELETAAAQS